MRPARARSASGLLAATLGICPGPFAVAGAVPDLPAAEKAALLTRLQAANATFDAGRFDEALRLYDALAADVDLAEVHFRRGACLERLGRPGDAAAAYRRYLELRPAAPDAGRVRFDIDRLEAEARRLEAARREAEAPASQAPPSAGTPPSAAAPDRTLPWAFATAGGVLAVGAGVLGWVAADAIDEANTYDRRAEGHSRGALEDLQGTASAYETTFWIVGGVALAAGLTSGVLFWRAGAEAAPSGGATTSPPPPLTVGPGGLRVLF
jgi:tetratricopeptide (TPR) repeat protein